jgi:predicted MFS family arabinose efflux permease
MGILDIIVFSIIIISFFVKRTNKVKLFTSSLLSAYCLYSSHILATNKKTELAIIFFIIGAINVIVAFGWLNEVSKETKN